ncbi:hypothetical protein BWP39_02920 [Paraburkholderia acidicola]|uniref:HTH merR-type domain-containing protein n=1 Tax=Paraburkholderia acidicola TaxID=1912599 RepID=A0A2A4F539_9BURK|nr:MerR family transcriptional regulator [Paraburkholderia acidicola]PCE27469.1 hypothetical protein BWP39_02920 [Paraburkholderia acidicola]
MKIGELAAKTGLAASAIRYYEQSGLLPEPVRGANGYRDYADTALERLRLIQIAQSLGFSLERLRCAFANQQDLSKEDLLHGVDMRLGEIGELMATLRAQRDELRKLRKTLTDTWEAGKCVDTGQLADDVAGVPASLPRKQSKQRKQPAQRPLHPLGRNGHVPA